MSTHKLSSPPPLQRTLRAVRPLDADGGAPRHLRAVKLPPQPGYNGPDGAVPLLELMQGRSQLVLYHFKFAPSVDGVPRAVCPGCTRYIDNIDRAALRELADRDASFALVSRAPVESLQSFKKRMSWKHTWVSADNDVAPQADGSESHGISIFTRDGDAIYRRYVTIARGMENVGPIWNLLDVPVVGRGA